MSRKLHDKNIVLGMHSDGGSEEEGSCLIPTPVWIRDCEIQVEANEHQKVSISREGGNLVVHFWTTGLANTSGPDYKATLTRLGGEGNKTFMSFEECINENS